MSYKLAGIDVHKKVLMVVVLDASTPEERGLPNPAQVIQDRSNCELGVG